MFAMKISGLRLKARVQERGLPVMREIRPQTSAIAERLHSLRAVILLDGTVRRSAFAESIDRSILELPLKSDMILLDLWREEIADLGETADLSRQLPCRIVLGQTTRAIRN